MAVNERIWVGEMGYVKVTLGAHLLLIQRNEGSNPERLAL